jgi:histidinol-phosphate aminotransferase
MKRRTFFQTGLALSAVGVGGISTRAAATAPVRGVPNGPIRLNSNENPLGLAPVARQAVIDGLSEANRYPGAKRGELVQALAAKHGVTQESVVLGAGSTEVLQMMVQATASRRTLLVAADPTFEHVGRYSLPENYRRELVPLTADLKHDLPRMREVAERSWDPVLVYICNPNNPTGTITACDEIDAWIGSAPDNIRFMIDEAYFEYANDPSYRDSIHWIADHPNVVVVRTFSKIYAMAGMRVGYGLAHPDTAAHLSRFMSGSNVNELALRAAVASLADSGLVQRSIEANRTAGQILYDCLHDLDVDYIPTHANFVMHRIKGDLREYIGRMRDIDIRVGRPFPPMLEYNRLSLGLPQEMERFAEALRGFRQKGWV